MADTLELGKVLNSRYEIISVLGRGGMSNVYLVEDEKLHSRWALKEMLDVFPMEQKTEILERFRKEAQILAGMKHPNLPRVFDYFEENDRHYLVMEYIEGLTLGEILEQNREVPVDKVLDWSAQICDVLESLHKEGIVYRDLKPSNVMVDKNNRISIIDFGIARLFSGNKIHDTIIIGTPGFASPEHHGTAETDFRSDIFSLGATMHFLLTGKDPGLMPFVFEDPRKLKPEIPEWLGKVVMKAVALNPQERYQTAGEMKEALHKGSPQKEKIAENKPEEQKTSAPVQVTTPASGATGFAGPKTYSTDLIKSYTYPTAVSGGVVSLLAWLISLGGGLDPILLLSSLGAWAPSAYLAKRVEEYVFRLPKPLVVRMSAKGIHLEQGTRSANVGWDEITGLLIFKEQSRVGLPVTKYRIFTRKGDFEYGEDMADLNQLNDSIILHAGLRLAGESGDYRRYSR